MSAKHESGLHWFFRVAAPKLTSIGAAVVIVGALFKIMHWPGAGLALTIGLLTEAFLFAIGALQPAPPPDAHYEWEKVYPQLASSEQAHEGVDEGDTAKANLVKTASIDAWLQEANLSADTFKSFGSGLKNLESNVGKMKDLSDAAAATNEYAKSARDASKNLNDLSKSYVDIVGSMTTMSKASKDAATNATEYHKQVQGATKNLASLNAVYEMELKDADQHIKSMNKFYGDLAGAMSNMADVSKESELFKQQMTSLTTNLTKLNTVYGNMLTAMKG